MNTNLPVPDSAPIVWRSVDTHAQLRTLNDHVCWSDSQTVEFYGTELNAAFFPNDVSRSGFFNKNIYVLVRFCPSSQYLEMVWIDCDTFSGRYIDHPYLSGRVDTLKRVEILSHDGEVQMRCSRLIYRFLDSVNVKEGRFYSEYREKDHR